MHLEQLGTARKFIKNLNYVSDGYGQVRIAVDAEGRVWRSAPNWDGYQGWTCDDGSPEVYFDRPVLRMDAAFDEDGTRIRL